MPWTEEPGGLQSIGSQRVRREWTTKHTHVGIPGHFSSLVFASTVLTFSVIGKMHVFLAKECRDWPVSLFGKLREEEWIQSSPYILILRLTWEVKTQWDGQLPMLRTAEPTDIVIALVCNLKFNDSSLQTVTGLWATWGRGPCLLPVVTASPTYPSAS